MLEVLLTCTSKLLGSYSLPSYILQAVFEGFKRTLEMCGGCGNATDDVF